MRRRYTTKFFAEKISRVKELIPDAFIGVDVIVGTRGETEECFEEAFEFISFVGCESVACVQLFGASRNDGFENRTFRFA